MKTLNKKGLILIISILTLFLIASAAQAVVDDGQPNVVGWEGDLQLKSCKDTCAAKVFAASIKI